jgi:hypothetical protein
VVLKAGGKLLLLEHGLSPPLHVQKWQHHVIWLQMRLADRCHPDQDTRALVSAQPFASVKLEEYNLEKTSKTHGYLYRGIAAK